MGPSTNYVISLGAGGSEKDDVIFFRAKNPRLLRNHTATVINSQMINNPLTHVPNFEFLYFKKSAPVYHCAFN